MARCRIGLQLPGRLPPIHDGKRQIHQDQIRQFLIRHGNALRTVARDDNFEPSSGQPTGQHVDVVGIVFDVQNFSHTNLLIHLGPRPIRHTHNLPAHFVQQVLAI